MKNHSSPRIVIACGGTGGHLFPGIAVAEKLAPRGCEVTLIISSKEVDKQAVKGLSEAEIVTLPAVGLRRGGEVEFLIAFGKSYQLARKLFRWLRPHAVLAMGGFTSAPPILAGKTAGARTFLHESNSIPGRANRWLSWLVDRGFVGFPSAAAKLKRCPVTVCGTPVRERFQPSNSERCRSQLGLDPERPVLLVMGGSQGAGGVNEIIRRSLFTLARVAPEWQWFHLAGPRDTERLRRRYAELNLRAIVHPFFEQMELALGAASATITRAGASTLAELSAMRLPALLVPYPAAVDNHQMHNARAYSSMGAAQVLDQIAATPDKVSTALLELVRNEALRKNMQEALARLVNPGAAEEIATEILNRIHEGQVKTAAAPTFHSLPLPQGAKPPAMFRATTNLTLVPQPAREEPISL